jgi:RNA polymerase subunit RPABC4/transcription elongation factor Spt4
MRKSKEPKKKEQSHTCPYCESEIVTAKPPYCQPCGVTLRYCVRCEIAVVREATVCPRCGSELEWR